MKGIFIIIVKLYQSSHETLKILLKVVSGMRYILLTCFKLCFDH